MSLLNEETASAADAKHVGELGLSTNYHAYLLCAFASFGDIFFGYDSGYINGINGSKIFIEATVIMGCAIYIFGIAIQIITGAGDPLAAIVAGHLITGVGVGFESAIVILYMSEICPREVRGALVTVYQFCITIGIMTASYIVYGTKDRTDTGAYIQFELAEIGSVFKANSNLRKTILGTSLHMMTGINFIFYYSTPFVQSTSAISNTFLVSLVFTLVNVFSTPISFWTFIIAVVGITVGFSHTHVDPSDSTKTLTDNISAVYAQVAFIATFIFFFASTWGPGAWILISEIFPILIRSRSIALSTASNWLWNTIIAVITPYIVGEHRGNLKLSVFFIWGGLYTVTFVYTYLFVPETKGLSLKQVDKMMRETVPRTSVKWKPYSTFAGDYRDDIRLVDLRRSI
ncbi:hypothetical protein B0T26DRAFT_744238 [Lasiosphaeria miniovina]|uniref:Major facilitator superfamily (MFS) profile domain-containing protein n=1 Tax=Lasiosphaeria miniovina TaxID=1954250 RepID=A0AA39ZTL5_9PEZI|nr:uncharacterized protein B0T26DRAFT_744238 [Lasiosphaeria miniovina]KAK0703328.1 hypothetical protein B0T26DRAFT_744238 [Lasiosphaeria miniovina]